MWILNAFDKQTRRLKREYVLQGIDGATLTQLLDLGPEDYPVEIAEHPVPVAVLPLLARYIDEPLVVDEGCNYHVGLESD